MQHENKVDAGLVAALVTLAALLPAARVDAQGLDVARPMTFVNFAGYGGHGFIPAPAPTSGALDSNLWIPFGAPFTTMFGGRCATSPVECGRGTATVLTGLLPGFHAFAGITAGAPGVLMQPAAIPSTVLAPGGLRLRIRGADPIPLRTMQVQVFWGERVLSPNPLHVRYDAGCDGVGGVELLRPMMTPTTMDGGWTFRRVAFPVVDAELPMGAVGCLDFALTADGAPTPVVLGDVTIRFPCGDGLVQLEYEGCDPADPSTPVSDPASVCACDPSTCQYPDVPCDDMDDNVCTLGMCDAGSCHSVDLDHVAVDGCMDDGLACNGFEGCVAGECSIVSECGDATDACHACDDLLGGCNVPIPGCCLSDSECPEICGEARCLANQCVVPVGCDEDAGLFEDAAVTPNDAGSPTGDAGSATRDGGRAMDAGSNLPGISFNGGGGCRCAAAGAGHRPTAAMAFAVAFALALARRRAARGRA